MLIRYSDGRVEPATLLSASNKAMHVAFTRGHASVEFTRLNGQWLSDPEGPVEIDFTAATTEREWRLFCDRLVGLDELAPWDAESLLAGCVPFHCGRGHIVTRRMLQMKRWMTKPFAIQLYERFTRGETIEQLAAALNIPVERIATRIRAAESYIRQHGRKAA